MSIYDLIFKETEESREIYREFRFTIIKLGIYSWDKQIMREHTHRFCLKYARKFCIKE
jgi:hypothetical protein